MKIEKHFCQVAFSAQPLVTLVLKRLILSLSLSICLFLIVFFDANSSPTFHLFPVTAKKERRSDLK